MKPLLISPSILSADFGKLNAEIAEVEPHSDRLHIDIMDGHFVPNLTIGPAVVRCIESNLPKHCHLMVDHPEDFVEPFATAGADLIIFHVEVAEHGHKLIETIRNLDAKVGISINPPTPVETLDPYLDDVDLVLIMSVNPGFGGQAFMPEVLPKIEYVRKKRPDIDIEIDGGINAETAKLAKEAGANILVAGSYIFGSEDRIEAIQKLRDA